MNQQAAGALKLKSKTAVVSTLWTSAYHLRCLGFESHLPSISLGCSKKLGQCQKPSQQFSRCLSAECSSTRSCAFL